MVDEQAQEAPQDVVARAEAILAEVKAREAKVNETYAKNQATEARIILGGRSGVEQAPPPREETPKEYADRILRGGI